MAEYMRSPLSALLINNRPAILLKFLIFSLYFSRLKKPPLDTCTLYIVLNSSNNSEMYLIISNPISTISFGTLNHLNASILSFMLVVRIKNCRIDIEVTTRVNNKSPK